MAQTASDFNEWNDVYFIICVRFAGELLVKLMSCSLSEKKARQLVFCVGAGNVKVHFCILNLVLFKT